MYTCLSPRATPLHPYTVSVVFPNLKSCSSSRRGLPAESAKAENLPADDDLITLDRGRLRADGGIHRVRTTTKIDATWGLRSRMYK